MRRIAFAMAKRKALIAYLTVGYPSVNTTLEMVPALAGWGCDIVELGIPFSDPLADGATIQKASHQALQNGVTPELCVEIASQLRQRTDVPLVFMSYYNPVLRFGLEAFCAASAQAGIDGLIIPDLPPEEGTDLERAAVERQLDLIYLLAPTSSDERVALVAQKSRGFIYMVSLTGVTGARETLPEGLEEFFTRVRKRTALPLCLGFGISNADQVRSAARIADGVIVGSRLIQLLDDDCRSSAGHGMGQFIGGLRKALDSS
ncbi:MAG: tryptophan synthase subunit alpha [Chloroflexi bacterium]|nr:tryptophan synthase subunit alpha [Chloroflexota bacterium]